MGLGILRFLIRGFNLGLGISRIGNILIFRFLISGFIIRDFKFWVLKLGIWFSILIRYFNLELGIFGFGNILILELGISCTLIKDFKFGVVISRIGNKVFQLEIFGLFMNDII